ncbi:cupredoxin domain-containing protein [Candidatus Microgenomates bacterium]|nr:cupredoxin domain-containing protein [Candidatus Microgenomates bacterium]
MSRNTTIGLVAVVLVILAGWYFIQSQKGGGLYPAPSPTPQVIQPETPSATETASSTPEVEKNVVKISASGFSPQNITISKGESVTWVNEDTQDHQVQSAVHPTHQVYPPLNTVGLLKSGEKKSLSFPKAGTYKYHDHLNPSLTGTVTVE